MLCQQFASLCIIKFVVIIRKATLLKRFLPNLHMNNECNCILSRQPAKNSKVKTRKIPVMFSLLFSIPGIKEAHFYSIQLFSLKTCRREAGYIALVKTAKTASSEGLMSQLGTKMLSKILPPWGIQDLLQGSRYGWASLHG